MGTMHGPFCTGMPWATQTHAMRGPDQSPCCLAGLWGLLTLSGICRLRRDLPRNRSALGYTFSIR